jgi:hypothetical protein
MRVVVVVDGQAQLRERSLHPVCPITDFFVARHEQGRGGYGREQADAKPEGSALASPGQVYRAVRGCCGVGAWRV